MATTSDLTIIKKHILTKAQYEALETINPNDEYYVIDDDGGNVKYSNEQALSDELKAVALKNIGVDTSISNINTQLESINTSITNIDNTLDTHQSDIATNANDIADLLTGLGDVLNRVDSTDNDIKNLQDKLDAIEGKIPVPEELDKEIVYVDKYSDLANLTDKSQEKLYFVYEENAIYSYDGTTFVEVDKPNNVIITEDIDSIPSMTLEDGNYSVIHIIKSDEQHNGGELYLESFNNKIQAIKCIRYFKGLSLRDAKTVIDAYPNGFPYLLATGLSDEMLIKYYQDYALLGVTLSYTLNSTESPVAKVAYNLEKGSNSKGGYTYKLSNAESVATYDFEIEEWVWKYYAYLDDLDNLADTKSDIGHTHEIADVNGLTAELDDKAPANHTHEQYLTAHQDISGKQDKTDNSLLTTVKTIVGAINELWTKFKDYLKGIQHVTYAQLKTMRDSGTLVAGQWYRITDYMTTVANDLEARSAGHPFDLLVMATNENTISEEAKAVKSARDANGYFADANLTAWKVWYCLDNDTTRFQWVDTENGKGVIYRMIDEWQNDCPYDFKNVQFKRYAITDDSPHGELGALNGKYYGYNGEMEDVHIEDENDFVWAYTFTLIDENDEWVDYSIKKEGALDAGTDWGYFEQFKIGRCEYNHIRRIYTAVTIDDQCYRTLMLNNIVLISTISEENGLSGEMQLNEFGTGNYNMTVKDNPEKNTFGNKCYNNIVGSYGNTFGNDCYYNTFGNNVYDNTFGNNFQYNTFGNNVYDNTFGNDCYYNTFGNSVSWNTFGNDCGGNTFGNGVYRNTFGNNVSWNTFGNNVYDNTFGNDCSGNTFGNSVSWNTFGNNCGGNTFGNYCSRITVHNGVKYVEVLGGNTSSAYVQDAQILNGTHGSNSSNRLQISFQLNADYCQYAGLNSSGILKIWTPADTY